MSQIIERIATTTGCEIERVILDDGSEVAVKRARNEAAAAHLADQKRHIRAMDAHLGSASVYPVILDESEDTLVLPWSRRGTLEHQLSVASRPVAEDLVSAALDAIFRIAAGGRELTDPAHAPTFLGDELVRRAHRLRAALQTPDGSRFAALHPEIVAELDELERWISDHDRFAAISPGSLGLCAHGDFGLDNALASDDGRPLFIDVRGTALWHRGMPWWDPILDLATVLVYHCRIEPAIAAICDDVGAARLDDSERLSEAELRALGVMAGGFALWGDDDPAWEPRLELAMLVRLLGSVSTQLTATPRHRVARATAVWRLAADQVAVAKGALDD